LAKIVKESKHWSQECDGKKLLEIDQTTFKMSGNCVLLRVGHHVASAQLLLDVEEVVHGLSSSFHHEAERSGTNFIKIFVEKKRMKSALSIQNMA
jgi:hypothetical protein